MRRRPLARQALSVTWAAARLFLCGKLSPLLNGEDGVTGGRELDLDEGDGRLLPSRADSCPGDRLRDGRDGVAEEVGNGLLRSVNVCGGFQEPGAALSGTASLETPALFLAADSADGDALGALKDA